LQWVHKYYLFILFHVLTSIQVLHPGLKLKYFRQKDWEDDWIDVAEELVHDVYIAHYQDSDNSITPGLEPVSESVSACLIMILIFTNRAHTG
jgi:hypothetical protein